MAAPTQQSWDLSVQYLKGVGDKLAALLAKSDIRTLWDLILTLPRTYEDRRHFFTLAEIYKSADQNISVLSKGEIVKYLPKQGAGGRRWLEAVVAVDDAQGLLDSQMLFTWFNDFGGSIQRRFAPGARVLFRGKVQSFRGALQMVHPDLQAADAELPWWEFGGFVPVYREVSGLSTRVLRKILAHAVERPEFKNMPESLPLELTQRLGLPSFGQSLRELHFPKHWTPNEFDPHPAGIFFTRIVFEELFLMSLALHLRRAEWKAEGKREAERIPRMVVNAEAFKSWTAKLPYALTHDQSQVLQDILADISLRDELLPMHRMVQGDVGSGKTIVAFLAALAAMQNGYQVAMMAPTEILADQHFTNFKKLFPEYASQVLLLKGALSAKIKKESRTAISSGAARFVIGTQALLTDTTVFEKLGLVIVDEQHRFGVEQRLNLKKQGAATLPHLLVMTATPIPRSLALTLYGDLSVSLIREKPPGRTPIRTHLLKQRQQSALTERLKRFLDEGRQIYLVYPLVEESEELDLKDVQNAFKEWQSAFPNVAIGLLHGRMKSSEKELAMDEFKSGRTKVLVSTTVIEVGVDVPNASVIAIFHAERFGLSQLHQLRGRVGRGAEQSFCILVGPNSMGPEVEERLKIMEQSEDGFLIAEKDLEIRGPGEFLGRRQSGLPGFRVAHILRDLELMERARDEAKKILDQDPKLQKSENQALRNVLQHWWKGRLDLTLSG